MLAVRRLFDPGEKRERDRDKDTIPPYCGTVHAPWPMAREAIVDHGGVEHAIVSSMVRIDTHRSRRVPGLVKIFPFMPGC